MILPHPLAPYAAVTLTPKGNCLVLAAWRRPQSTTTPAASLAGSAPWGTSLNIYNCNSSTTWEVAVLPVYLDLALAGHCMIKELHIIKKQSQYYAERGLPDCDTRQDKVLMLLAIKHGLQYFGNIGVHLSIYQAYCDNHDTVNETFHLVVFVVGWRTCRRPGEDGSMSRLLTKPNLASAAACKFCHWPMTSSLLQ